MIQLENCPWWRIVVQLTMFWTETLTIIHLCSSRFRPQSYRTVDVWHRAHFELWPWLLTFDLDLDLQSQESYGHNPYTCKKSRSKVTQCKVRVDTYGRTDGWTEVTALLPVLMRLITNWNHKLAWLFFIHYHQTPNEGDDAWYHRFSNSSYCLALL